MEVRKEEQNMYEVQKSYITKIVDNDLNKLNDDGRAVQTELSPQYL